MGSSSAGDTIRSISSWNLGNKATGSVGRKASDDTFRDAAEAALAGALAREHNYFKIELAKRTIVRAFATATEANV